MWVCRTSCSCSVTQLCPTLCEPMDCSTPGFPFPQSLLKFMLSNHLILCRPFLLLPSMKAELSSILDCYWEAGALRTHQKQDQRWPFWPGAPFPLGGTGLAFWTSPHRGAESQLWDFRGNLTPTAYNNTSTNRWQGSIWGTYSTAVRNTVFIIRLSGVELQHHYFLVVNTYPFLALIIPTTKCSQSNPYDFISLL